MRYEIDCSEIDPKNSDSFVIALKEIEDDSKEVSLLLRNALELDEAGQKMIIERLDKYHSITTIRFPELDEMMVSVIDALKPIDEIKQKRASEEEWDIIEDERDFPGLNAFKENYTASYDLKRYKWENFWNDKVRRERYMKILFCKKHLIANQLEGIAARNRQLQEYGLSVKENTDPWQVLAAAFSERVVRDVRTENGKAFEFYSSAIVNGEYAATNDCDDVNFMGAKLLRAYLSYLNTIKNRYKTVEFPYQVLRLSNGDLYHQFKEISTSTEELQCLNEYLENKENFFPFSKIVLVWHGDLNSSDNFETVSKLLKLAFERGISDIKILRYGRYDRSSNIAESVVEGLEEFIKKHHITTGIMFSDWKEINRRLDKAVVLNKQKRNQVQPEAMPADSPMLTMPDDFSLKDVFKTATPRLDIEISFVHQLQKSLNYAQAFNTQEELQQELDQEQESDTTVLLNKELFLKEWAPYDHSGSPAYAAWRSISPVENHPKGIKYVTKKAAQALQVFRSAVKEGFSEQHKIQGFFIRENVLFYNENLILEEKNLFTPRAANATKKYIFDFRLRADVSIFLPGEVISWPHFFELDKNSLTFIRIYDGNRLSEDKFRDVVSHHYKQFIRLYPKPATGIQRSLLHLLLCGIDNKEHNFQIKNSNSSSKDFFNAPYILLCQLLIEHGQDAVSKVLETLTKVYEITGQNNVEFKLFLNNWFAEHNYLNFEFISQEKGAQTLLNTLESMSEEQRKFWFHSSEKNDNSEGLSLFELDRSIDLFTYFFKEFDRLCPGQPLPNLKFNQVRDIEEILYLLEHSSRPNLQLPFLEAFQSDLDAAYYAMRYDKFEFVAPEMSFSIRDKDLFRKQGFWLSATNLTTLYFEKKLADKESKAYCTRLYGLHWSKMAVDYPQFKEILGEIPAIPAQILATFLCQSVGITKEELLSYLRDLTISDAEELLPIVAAWQDQLISMPSVDEFKQIHAWMKTQSQEQLDALKAHGPNLVLLGEEYNEEASERYQQLKGLLTNEFLDQNPVQLLGIWQQIIEHIHTDKENEHYLLTILKNQPNVNPTQLGKFLALLADSNHDHYSLREKQRVLALFLKATPNQKISLSVVSILCRYGEKANGELLKYLCEQTDASLAIIDKLTQCYLPSVDVLIRTGALNANSVIELECDPHQRLELLDSANIEKLDEVLDNLFLNDEKKQTTFKRYYHRIRHLMISQFNELGYDKIQEKLEEIRKAIKDSPSEAKKLDLILQYLALTCLIMYRSTGLLPNCTQILASLYAASTNQPLMLGVESNEGKSLLAALHASMQHLLGRTSVITTANRNLSKRDFQEFEGFYRYMGIEPVKYLKANSKLEDFQPAGVYYADNGDFELFFAQFCFEGHYSEEDYHLAFIVDEVHEVALTNYQMQYRNVRAFGGDLYFKHPVPQFFNWINTYIDDPEHRTKTLHDLIAWLHGKNDPVLNDYLNTNYKTADSWRLLLSSAHAAKQMKHQEHFVLREETRLEEGKLITYQIARPRTIDGDRVNKHSQFTNTVQQFLHARLQYHPEFSQYKFPIEQELQGSTCLTGDNLIELASFNKNNALIGMSATLGSIKQREELERRYPGLILQDFTPHKEQKRRDHDEDGPKVFNSEQEVTEWLSTLIENGVEENRENNQQPVLIICESIKDTETIYALLKEKTQRPIQMLHSDGFKESTSASTKKKISEFIKQAGNKNQISISSTLLETGTNIESADKENGLLVISLALGTEIQHEQTKRRAARKDDPGEFVWALYRNGNQVDVIRTEKYQHEKAVRGVNAQIASIKLEKFLIVSKALNQLRGTGDFKSLSILQENWVQFLNEIEVKWHLIDAKNEAITQPTIDDFRRDVNELFERQFKLANGLIEREPTHHETAVSQSPEFKLKYRDPHNENLASYLVDPVGVTLEMKPFWDQEKDFLKNYHENELPQEFQAWHLSSDTFSFETRLLDSKEEHSLVLQLLSTDQPFFQELTGQMGKMITSYLGQKNVAQYRRKNVEAFLSEMKNQATLTDLLDLINKQGVAAFTGDENHNEGTFFFKRNRLFSRYQLLLQHLRAVVLVSIPPEQAQKMLEVETANLIEVTGRLGFSSSATTYKQFLLDIKTHFKDDRSHYMSSILTARVGFLLEHPGIQENLQGAFTPLASNQLLNVNS